MVDTHSSNCTEIKDSGIDWIGYIPKSWSIRTLYQLVSQVKCKNRDLQEKNLLSLSYGKIKRKDIDSPEGLLPASFDGYNIIEAGDIVLRLTDLQNDHASLRVGLATERGIITSAYTTLRPINPRHSKYIYYLLHAFDLKKGFYGMGSGVRQGLNYDEVKELRVVLPIDTEQEVITAYLDDQCQQIDSMIDEAKKSIEEYKDWKASIIYEAVTKGLNPNAEMKDSGIQWIGEFPYNWDLVKIKHIFSISSGSTPKTDIPEFWDGDVLWITPADFKTEYKYVSGGKRNISNKGLSSCSASIVPKGSIIFSKRAPIGEVAIAQENLSTNQGCLSCTPLRNDNVDFFYYAISAFRGQFELLGSGTTFKEISASAFGGFKLPYPDIDTQHKIARYLDERCSKINQIIMDKNALISDLESYKRSLIYETITGKRKVV